MATECMPNSVALNFFMFAQPGIDQRATSPSQPPEAMNSPLRAIASVPTAVRWTSFSDASQLPFGNIQRWTFVPSPDETMAAPSGEKTTAATFFACFICTPISAASLTDQSRIDASNEALASNDPSGE